MKSQTRGPDRFVVFDIETTGLNPWKGDRIIELGAVSLTGGRPGDEFHSLIDAGVRMPKTVSKIHGITAEMLAGKPKPEEVLRAFCQFAGASPLVAHNAHFDMNFLRCECSRVGLKIANPCLCTLKLSGQVYPWLTDHRLETVARHVLGSCFDKKTCHHALEDARLTARIWLEMRER